MTPPGDIIYRVNDQDEIVFVNEAWDGFALANAGESITSAKILQTSLWNYIVDRTTRELYHRILARAREGCEVRFNFRCDSPACRRLLLMEIARGMEPGTVQFCTRTLWLESRSPVPLLVADFPRSKEQLRLCGWCKKLLVGESWEEVEVAIERLQLFNRDSMPTLIHKICEECRQTLSQSLPRE